MPVNLDGGLRGGDGDEVELKGQGRCGEGAARGRDGRVPELEDADVCSTHCISDIEKGLIPEWENVPAPKIAIVSGLLAPLLCPGEFGRPKYLRHLRRV